MTTTPKTIDELTDLIKACSGVSSADPSVGYEESADNMWKAAAATFNYVASELGVTGFQASWAALRFYREVMHVKGPFTIVKVDDALYPQYDLPGRVQEFIDEQRDYLRDQARARLAEGEEHAHPRVVEHWKKLAEDES